MAPSYGEPVERDERHHLPTDDRSSSRGGARLGQPRSAMLAAGGTLLVGVAGVALWVALTYVLEHSFHFQPFFVGALLPVVHRLLRRVPASSMECVGLGVATVSLVVMGAALIHLSPRAAAAGVDSPWFSATLAVFGCVWGFGFARATEPRVHLTWIGYLTAALGAYWLLTRVPGL